MPVPNAPIDTPVLSRRRIQIRKILATILTIGLSISGANSAPVVQSIEHAVETALASYAVNATGYGFVTIHDCRDCQYDLSLRITPESRLIVDGLDIGFSSHPRPKPRLATLYYRPSDQVLTRMVLH